ncbi:hypothetical protein ACIQC8_08455 [Agrococcus sediminis]|uniref:hypothetical protein n=1 Tax=Agrococcus sediminis TaxID=2599924 RepID=UPI0037F68555
MTGDSEPSQPRARRELVVAEPGLRPERDDRFTRLRRGVYVDRPVIDASCADGSAQGDARGRDARYLSRIRAVQIARSRPVFARESALALHGVPFGTEPPAVYTAGGARTAKKKAGVVHSPVVLDPRDVMEVGEMRVCSLAYALADVARRRGRLVAVSAIDAALHAEAVTKEAMLEALGRQSARGRARAEWAIAFADVASESVGESWSRVRVFELGFAAPELQRWVEGPTGRRWRVDMRFERPGRRPVYGEFDGMTKYGELATRAGRTGTQALAKEKQRDDDLLWTGDPAHWVWDDVLHPARLERILTAYRVPRVRSALPMPTTAG